MSLIKFFTKKELCLFSDDEMNPRQNADRDDVRKIFSPIAEKIILKILEAGNTYMKIAEDHPVARQEHTFTSSTLHGLIIESLSQIKGVRVIKFNKKNSFLEVGSYKVWVKKLDDKGLPYINKTKSSINRAYQKAHNGDVLPLLILGFTLDNLDRISQIQLIYIKGDQYLWEPINLYDLLSSSEIIPITQPTTDKLNLEVKPEKKRDREKIIL